MKTLAKRKLIIDTDPGHDDALAILLAFKSGEFEVQAITTVAGNSSIENVTRNAQAILDLAGAATPVFSGSSKPLRRKLVQAVVHGEDGLAGFDTSRIRYRLTGNAPEKIIELVREFPGEVTILAIGPLTNIARAFQIDPELPGLIQELVIMGGAIEVPGNKNRVAEFNFFVDPEAAEVIFKANVPRVLVPLDVCSQVTLQLEDFQTIANEPLKNALSPMMKHFVQGLMSDEGTSGILAFDALAAYALLNRQAFTLTPMNIAVETKGEHTFGMTVAERRPHKSVPPNALVAMAIDGETFKRDFFAILSK